MSSRITVLSCALCALLVPGIASAATEVGVAAAVNPDAEGTPPGQSVRSISLGQNIIHNERIVTGDGGLVHILLVDGTSLTIGSNSDLTIDSFIYDPEANTAEVAATLTKGVLRFIGGRASKTDGASIDSPVGTVGIRGGIGIFGVFDGSGGTEQPAFHCLYGNCNASGSEMQAGESAYFGDDGVQIAPTDSTAVAAVEARLKGQSGTDGGSNVDENAVDEKVSNDGPTDPDEDPNGPQDDGDAAATNDPTQELVVKRDVRLLLQGTDGALGGDGETITLKLKKTDFPSVFAATGDVTEGPHTGSAGVPFIFGGSLLSITSVLGESSLGPLTGNVYARKDFEAWLLATSLGEPFYAVSGVAPDFAATFADEDNVRRYQYFADPFQDVPVPFFQSGIITNFDADGIADIYVIEPSDPDTELTRLFQGWLQINGSGSTQESAVGVTVGQFEADTETGEFGLTGQRSGSYRQAADGAITNLIGGVASVAGPTGDHVFGPNGTNFLLTDSGTAFSDVPNSTDGPDEFTSIHVADLIDDDTPAAQTLDRTLTGFAAGMLESFGEGVSLSAMRSGGLEASVAFDAATNTLGGLLTIHDAEESSVTALFGDEDRIDDAGGTAGAGYAGASVFVNDDLFAATQSTTDEVYVLTADAVPDYDFMPSGSAICSACSDWSEWGWWGGLLDDGSVHLGTWVVGDIATWDDVTSGRNTIEGHVVGSVADSSGTLTQYVAGGTSRVTWDDTLGIGLVSFVDFDGETYGGVLRSTGSGSDPALLSAVLYGATDLGIAGASDGAFALDGGTLAGALGDFDLDSGDYSSSGTFLGAIGGATEATAPLPFRILTSSTGSSGLVGGTDYDESRNLTLSFGEIASAPTLIADGTIDQGSGPLDLTLQAFVGDSFTSAAVDGSSLDGVDLTGSIYYGTDLFSAYLLAVNGDFGDPLYAITGTPTGDSGVLEGTDIRRYSLSLGVDPGMPVPFFQGALPVGGASPYASTDLFVVESPTNGLAQVFQAWVQIDGQGLSQKSAVGLTLGDGDGDGLQAARTGSYRFDAGGETTALLGSIGTVAGPTGAEIFGPNAQNFVLGGDVDTGAGFSDVTTSGTSQSLNTLHVANLVEEQATFSASQSLSGTLQGFAAGVLESDTDPLAAMRSGGLDVSVNFDTTTNTMGGLLTVYDAGMSPLTALFGDADRIGDAGGTAGAGYEGSSVYVNDDLFAGVQSASDSVYVLTADAVPDYDFMPSGSTICAACDWGEWGWWGGLLADGSVHLGTWTIADISDWTSVTTELGTDSATFVGHAAGAVATNVDNVPVQYVFGGSSALTWNNDLGIGLLSFVDVDGRNVGGVVRSVGSGSAPSLLSAVLYDSGPLGRTGEASGAFASDTGTALAGVLGDFGLDANNYAATGTFLSAYDASADEATAPLPFRILTASGTDGIVGGANYDESLNLTLSFGEIATNAALLAEGTIDQGSGPLDVTLQAFVGDSFTTTAVAGSSFDGKALSGSVYYGPDLFSAYLLTYMDGAIERPFYAVTGTHTDIQATAGTDVFEGSDVRTYAFTADPLQDIAVPFMLNVDLGSGPVFTFSGTGFASTPIYVAETTDLGTGPSPRVLQSWLTIEGTGASQVSAVGVNVGSIFDDGDYRFETGRRGSYRADDEGGSYHFSGGIATVSGPVDGNSEFFGANAEAFLLNTIIDLGDELHDNPALGGGVDAFATTHLAQLTTTVPGVGTSVPDGTFTGFAAGMVTCPDCGSGGTFAMVSGSTTDVELRLEAASRTVGGHITVGVAEFGPDDLQDFTVGFGTEGTNARSAYIDENIYAARDSNVSTQTNATILVSSTPTAVSQDPSYNAKTYVVSSDTVPTDGAAYMNGASCTNCDFIEWGWWGTQADLTDGGSTTAQASVHLGTWVAGEVSTHAEIDAYHNVTHGVTTDVTATYNGQAVGTVINNGAQYVAGGSVEMHWNLGAREGSWDVTNYDGKAFGGDISGAAGTGPATFMGELAGGTALTGDVNGAFVSDGIDPAAGVIGDFSAQDGVWSTVGTFGASGGVDP